MAQIVCKQCGKAVEKRTGTVFCGTPCKNAYWREQNHSTNGNEPEKPIINLKKTDTTVRKPDSTITIVPPTEIEASIMIENPTIKQLVKSRTDAETEKKRLTLQKVQLENRITEFDSPLKNHIALMGGFSGLAILAKSEDKLVPIVAGGIGAILGLIIGKSFDEKSKKRGVIEKPKIRMELDPVESKLLAINKKVIAINTEISLTPRTVVKKIMQPNPAFKEYQQKLRMAYEVEVLTQRQKEMELEEDRIAEERKKPLGKIISSSQLANIPFNALNFTGKWKGFLGLPSVDFLMVIHGKPGGGKSTFSVKLAHYLAEMFGEALFVSGEEGFSKTLKDKLVNSNAISNDLSFADLHSLSDVLEHVPQGRFNFILLDSLNNMRIDTAGLQQLRDHFKGCAIIAIAQSTKDGKMRGSNEIIHDCDIEVSVSNGIATTIKNRFFKTGTNYPIFDEPEAPTKEPPVVKLPKNIIE